MQIENLRDKQQRVRNALGKSGVVFLTTDQLAAAASVPRNELVPVTQGMNDVIFVHSAGWSLG